MTFAEENAACLSFNRATARAACESLASASVAHQKAVLESADYTGGSLYLWRAAQECGVDARLAHAADYRERLRKNAIRLERRRAQAAEVAEILRDAGIRFAVIKGFLLEPDFFASAVDRQQNDIDLYFSPGDAEAAYDLLLRAGYWSHEEREASGPAVHLPMLFPKNFVDRDGDFYNPDTQAVVELHDRLWPSEFERIRLEFAPDPLTRLVEREGLPTLHPVDMLATCTLHVMRHVFRGNLRVSHLYELASFLEINLDNQDFWRAWIADVNAPMRAVSTAALALASRVFESRWPPMLDRERNALPSPVKNWIARYGTTTVDRERPEKARVFLQLAFVPGWRDRLIVLQRRLAPTRIPHNMNETTQSGRLRFLASRVVFHTIAFFRFMKTAAELWL